MDTTTNLEMIFYHTFVKLFRYQSSPKTTNVGVVKLGQPTKTRYKGEQIITWDLIIALFFYKFYNYIMYYIKIEVLYELNMIKLY